MNYRTCKCGSLETWDSGFSFADCNGCEKCGTTTYKDKEGNYILTKEHMYEEKYDENTGKKFLRCKKCFKKMSL